MKKIFLFAVILFYQMFYAQEVSKGKIEYDMTLNFENIKRYHAELVYNNEKSSFIYTNLMQDRIENTDENGNISIIAADSIPKIIHVDKKRQKIFSYLPVYSNKEYYWIEEENPKIEWTLADETKKIGSLLCNKAYTTFKGRNYTAWYCVEIKGGLGPWKLQGLPGMILEAYDDKKEVVFLLKKIEIPFNSIIEFNLSKINPINAEEAKKIEKEKFDEMRQRTLSSQGREFKIKIDVKYSNTIEKE